MVSCVEKIAASYSGKYGLNDLYIKAIEVVLCTGWGMHGAGRRERK
jgi:hypothetical protein